MIDLVNLIRRLTIINILCLTYMKHERCSQLYALRQVFIHINFLWP